MMESALTARDRVGVQDFVLLENYTSEAAFIENLRKRFKENLIYVSGNFVDKAFSVSCFCSGLIVLQCMLGGFFWNLIPAFASCFPNICVFSPPRPTSVRCWCR